MSKHYLIVEGHGEVMAALNLITRLWRHLNLPAVIWSDPPLRGLGLLSQAGILRCCEQLRSKHDCAGALIIRDEDDGCPRISGPEAAAWIQAARLPFPVAVVLAYREYEAWFLPCIHLMAGRPLLEGGISRPGLIPAVVFHGGPQEMESIRDVKGWLSRHFPPNRAYKPRLDQLPLTRMIDIPVMLSSGLSSVGTLERALRFLADRPADSHVYPHPTPRG